MAVFTGLGSEASPSITFSADTDTGIFSPGANQLALGTSGNGRLFIDAVGFVGIGAAPAGGFSLDVRGFTRILSQGAASSLEVGTGTMTSQFAVLDLTGDTTHTDYGMRLVRGNAGANTSSSIRHRGTGPLTLLTDDGGPITFDPGGIERARFTTSGQLVINGTTAEVAHNLQVNGVIGLVSGFANMSFLESSGGDGYRWTLANDSTFRLQYSTDGFSTADTPIFVDSTSKIGLSTPTPTALLDINSDTFRLRSARTPASAAAAGAAGEICWDVNYIYVCTATNTWKRVAIATW